MFQFFFKERFFPRTRVPKPSHKFVDRPVAQRLPVEPREQVLTPLLSKTIAMGSWLLWSLDFPHPRNGITTAPALESVNGIKYYHPPHTHTHTVLVLCKCQFSKYQSPLFQRLPLYPSLASRCRNHNLGRRPWSTDSFSGGRSVKKADLGTLLSQASSSGRKQLRLAGAEAL